MKQSIYTLSACALVAAAMLAGCDKAGNATAPAAAPASAPAAVPPAEPAQQAALTTEVFNPGEKAIFAVSSVLVQGKSEVVLIDAQFSAEQARKLADKIKATGKRLTTIYISHGDPDFYFGLDSLHAAGDFITAARRVIDLLGQIVAAGEGTWISGVAHEARDKLRRSELL